MESLVSLYVPAFETDGFCLSSFIVNRCAHLSVARGLCDAATLHLWLRRAPVLFEPRSVTQKGEVSKWEHEPSSVRVSKQLTISKIDES